MYHVGKSAILKNKFDLFLNPLVIKFILLAVFEGTAAKVVVENIYVEENKTHLGVDSVSQVKITTAKQIKDDRIVNSLVKKSNRILVSISSHAFPIDLFPNSLIVEEGRVTIVNRKFLSSDVHSVDIRNISNVLIHTTFFFSQLVIISKTFEENEIKIINLRTNEAVYVRRIIEGLRTFENKKIQTSVYTTEELLSTLEELSTTEIVL